MRMLRVSMKLRRDPRLVGWDCYGSPASVGKPFFAVNPATKQAVTANTWETLCTEIAEIKQKAAEYRR